MPLITDLIRKSDSNENDNTQKRTKFKRKAYRPWDEELLEKRVDETQSYNNLEEALESSIIDHSPHALEPVLRGLYGIQKNILKYLLKNIESKDDNFCYTKAITTKSLTLATQSHSTSVQVSLQRLKQKKLLETFEHKTGRGGYSRYKIKREIVFLIDKVEIN